MKNILFLFLLSFCIASCDSRTYEDVSGIPISNPTYVTTIKPIVTSNCINCHSSSIQLPNLETYEEVKAQALNGNLLCRISGSSCGAQMPLGGQLPQNQIDAFVLWAQNGFVN